MPDRTADQQRTRKAGRAHLVEKRKGRAPELGTYQRKRDFSRTPEPSGGRSPKASGPAARWAKLTKGHRFCVQLHRASRLHYDFRLEYRGVLLSWAVPKGPSLDPSQRRLAVQVEDHPIDYGDFEDVIPSGYGAGTVMLWDVGNFEFEKGPKGDAERGLKEGHLDFHLEGQKLRGGFSLIRMDHGKPADKPQWLLIKRQDDQVREGGGTMPDTSVKSGRTLDEISAGAPAHPSAEASARSALEDLARAAPSARMPARVEPMLATLVDAPFSDPRWVFELKYDGVRALLRCQGDQLTLQGRSGRDETERYPELEQARPFLQARECLIDGEIVALDQDGRPSFSALQQRIGLRPSQAAEAARERPVTLMAFDLLFADGHDLRRLPLEERKRALLALIQENPLVRYADEIPEQGEEFYRQVSRLQLEGVIAKRARSTYASGKRTRDWLKIRVRPTQDCVICGYAPGKGRRSEIGALILGVFVEGELSPAGRVGTGFSDRQLAELRGALDRISRRTPPWSEREAADRDVIWASPKLVCEVEHAGWTVTGKLRQPSFRTLRPDVPPRACIRAPELSGEEVRVSYSGKSQPTETTSPGPPDGDREIDQALQELAELPAKGGPLRVGEHTVAVTHLDKLLWPEDGLTKRDLIEYHLRVSRYLLPHLRDRAIVTQVFPDGIGGKSFWRRAVPDTAPKWLARWQAHPGTPTICPLVQEPAALVWLANQGAIEIHPWHSRRDRPTQPDWAVFDLDPGPKAGWSGAVEVAHLVKAGLDHLKTEGWLKTTGQSGLHIYVPIRRGPVEEVVRDWVGQLGHQVAQVAPQLVTETWSVRARGGLVRIDYTQNVIGKTLASVYSPRPAPGAPVSTPIGWDELDGLDPKRFSLRTVADRVRDRGELFAPVLRGRQRLPSLKGLGTGAKGSGGSTTRRK